MLGLYLLFNALAEENRRAWLLRGWAVANQQPPKSSLLGEDVSYWSEVWKGRPLDMSELEWQMETKKGTRIKIEGWGGGRCPAVPFCPRCKQQDFNLMGCVCMSGSKYKCVLLSFRSKRWGPERVGCHAAHMGGGGQGVGLLPAGELWWVAHSPGKASQAARLRREVLCCLLFWPQACRSCFQLRPWIGWRVFLRVIWDHNWL